MIGAVLLTAGCGGFGFSLAASHRREVTTLRNLISAIQEMEWELKYRMTELPELCQIAGDYASGSIRDIFHTFSRKLMGREVNDISAAFNALIGQWEFPPRVRRNLKQLGTCLGRYDLEGQLQGLQTVRQQCRKDLRELEHNSIQRLRNYQTLALCTGAALAILFI